MSSLIRHLSRSLKKWHEQASGQAEAGKNLGDQVENSLMKQEFSVPKQGHHGARLLHKNSVSNTMTPEPSLADLYPSLWLFFGGYMYPHWRDEFPDEWALADAFVRGRAGVRDQVSHRDGETPTPLSRRSRAA